MAGIVQIGLGNAAIVAAAAPIVWLIGKTVRKPALTHALWVIVLMKLVTPPVWVFPVLVHETVRDDSRSVARAPVATAIVSAGEPRATPHSIDVGSVSESLPEVTIAPMARAVAPTRSYRKILWDTWPWALETVWLGGSVICLTVAMVRILKFARSLRHARAGAADVQMRVRVLARRLDLDRVPVLWFIPGRLCPMLWAVGFGARLLIPRELWDGLSPGQRDAIVVHELAHWRRRDHWVRWVELVATSLYWWHPACWWARRELRSAEEQCCDAWVVWALGDFRHYANALLEAVEFVSLRADRPSARIAVPALASGMGQFADLKRRIIMIKSQSVSRTMSRAGFMATFAVGMLMLPLSFSMAQESPKNEKAGTESPAAAQERLGVVVTDQATEEPKAESRELREARRTIEELSRKLEEAQARIAVLQAHDVRELTLTAPGGATVRVDRPGSAPGAIAVNPGAAQNGQPEVPGVRDGHYRTIITDPATGRIKEIRTEPMPGTVSTDRLDRIEAQLRDLLHEVETMKAPSGGGGNNAPRS